MPEGLSFTYERTISLSDADAAGVLYFARYFTLAHEAYERFMDARGLPVARIIREGQYVVPVVHAESVYKAPLMLGETARMEIEIEKSSRRSFTARCVIHKEDGTVAAVVRTTHVAVDRAKQRAVPMPEELARAVGRVQKETGG